MTANAFSLAVKRSSLCVLRKFIHYQGCSRIEERSRRMIQQLLLKTHIPTLPLLPERRGGGGKFQLHNPEPRNRTATAQGNPRSSSTERHANTIADRSPRTANNKESVHREAGVGTASLQATESGSQGENDFRHRHSLQSLQTVKKVQTLKTDANKSTNKTSEATTETHQHGRAKPLARAYLRIKKITGFSMSCFVLNRTFGMANGLLRSKYAHAFSSTRRIIPSNSVPGPPGTPLTGEIANKGKKR